MAGSSILANEESMFADVQGPMLATAHDGQSAAKEWLDDIKSIKDAFGTGSGISASSYFKTVAEEWKERLSSLRDWCLDSDNELKPDDNIYVPAYQKTLLGSDFSTLYNGSVSLDTVDTEAGSGKFLKPKTSYDTEMYSSVCTSFNPVSFDALPAHKKAVYEISLLTKAYASVYDGKNQDDVMDGYEDVMSQYKDYCDNNSLDWTAVMTDVSNEFQTECYKYKSAGDEDGFNMAGLSHSLMLTAAGKEYKDYHLPAAQQMGLSYDDTLSVNGHDLVDHKSILNKAGDTLHGAVSGVTNFVGGAWNKIRSACQSMADNVDVDSVDNPVAKKIVSVSKDALELISGSEKVDREAMVSNMISDTVTPDNSDEPIIFGI